MDAMKVLEPKTASFEMKIKPIENRIKNVLEGVT